MIYTLINLTGSLFPLICTVLYAFFIDEKILTMSAIAGRGEITIICIPLSITVLYTLYNYKKEVGIEKWPDLIYWFTFFLLIIATILYAHFINRETGIKNRIVYFSYFFLFWTFISLYASKYIEDQNIQSIGKSRNNEQDELESKFKNSRTS